MVSYLVLRLRLESGFGSTIQETLAWDGASWSESGGSSCQKGDRVRTEYGLCTGPAHLPALKVKDGHLQEPGTVPQGTYAEEPCPTRVHALSCSLVMVGRKGTNAQQPPARSL